MTIRKSQQISEITKALIAVQAKIKDPDKNTKGYNYKYADLPSVLQLVRPVLTENGLCVTQLLTQTDNQEMIRCTTLLIHESGQYFESTFAMPIEVKKGMSQAQCIGSTCTYMRRYTLQALIGIAADEDTDHNDVKPSKTNVAKKNDVSENTILKSIQNAHNQNDLDAIAKIAQDIKDPAVKKEMRDAYTKRKQELTSQQGEQQ